jgi:hypothetical protein
MSIPRFAGPAFVAAALALVVAGSAKHASAKAKAAPPDVVRDLYVYGPTNRPQDTVITLTVTGLIKKGVQQFDVRDTYRVSIDRNSDYAPDLGFNANFGPVQPDGTQPFTISTLGGSVLGVGSTGADLVLDGGIGVVRAGLFADPYFADETQIANFVRTGDPNAFATTWTNTRAGFNVLAIVFDLPTTSLATQQQTVIGVWGSIFRKNKQISRGARPLVDSIFLPKGSRGVFAKSPPTADTKLRGAASAYMRKRYERPKETADVMADILFPDVALFDTARPHDGFPNGRRPTDDAATLMAASIGYLLEEHQSPFASSTFQSPPFMPAKN